MTEEKAKEKWCPFAREHSNQVGGAVSINRQVNGTGRPSCMCLTTDCACWVEHSSLFESGHCGLIN